MRRELCDSAKSGKLCIDDLCRSKCSGHSGAELGAEVAANPDNTLCGFDQSLYEELCQESEDSDEDQYDAADSAFTADSEERE